jgi:hypothetical protein
MEQMRQYEKIDAGSALTIRKPILRRFGWGRGSGRPESSEVLHSLLGQANDDVWGLPPSIGAPLACTELPLAFQDIALVPLPALHNRNLLKAFSWITLSY